VPHHGSRCSGIALRVSRADGTDGCFALPRICANSLRATHASPWLTQRSTCSLKFTRSTLPNGSLRRARYFVFLAGRFHTRWEEPGAGAPWLVDYLSSMRDKRRRNSPQCSQPGKRVSTVEPGYFGTRFAGNTFARVSGLSSGYHNETIAFSTGSGRSLAHVSSPRNSESGKPFKIRYLDRRYQA
jgi:hypothetical protein